ncbi:MAG: hypothetical protein M3O01_13345 [Pseudomonadota bacterium]|nr:hypothetical protein [Pseudomonadota bacterium]
MEPMPPMKPMEPMRPMAPMAPMERWWPEGFGEPDSAGSQNDTRYAYFGSSHRLVVSRGGAVTIYDTRQHRITGFGQQQGGAADMAFQTPQGRVDLQSLRVVG